MFFVYFGYQDADNYDRCPLHELVQFETEAEVLKHYKEFYEQTRDNDEAKYVFYRVIKGQELAVGEKARVTEFVLEAK
jgi:hypothetical protein